MLPCFVNFKFKDYFISGKYIFSIVRIIIKEIIYKKYFTFGVLNKIIDVCGEPDRRRLYTRFWAFILKVIIKIQLKAIFFS